MARWKLMASHYLNVIGGTEWEYQETDRKTGRQKRVKFPVPRHLDIYDPDDWTVKWGPRDAETGEIIVCHEGKGEPTDIEFTGDPTPDMSPLDDEAREISASFESKWNSRPEDITLQGYSQSLVDRIMLKPEPTQVEGMSDLIGAIAALAKNQSTLMERLAAPPPHEHVRRL